MVSWVASEEAGFATGAANFWSLLGVCLVVGLLAAIANSIPILGVIENMSAFTDHHGDTHALFGSGGGQQLADDAEQLAKIDEMIRAVNTAFPLLDPTLLGMVADGTLPPPPAPSPAGPFAIGELDELNPEEDSPASAATSMGSDDREPEEL